MDIDNKDTWIRIISFCEWHVVFHDIRSEKSQRICFYLILLNGVGNQNENLTFMLKFRSCSKFLGAS